LAAQLNVLESWADGHGYKIVARYEDAGLSAKNTHRPALQQMLDDVKSRQFDLIAVWALSRFTRSVSDLYSIWSDILEPNKIKLVSITEGFDTDTVAGRAMMGLLGVFAQMERELTSERVKLAQEERARQGKRTCSYILGYDRDGTDGLSINGQEAEIVRFIFDALGRGKTLSQVAEECSIKGYHGKRGAKLTPEHIQRIARRRTYTGYYHFHGEWYKGNHEPIISEGKFQKVQKKLNKKYKDM